MQRFLIIAVLFGLGVGKVGSAKEVEIQGTIRKLDLETGVVALKPLYSKDLRTYSLIAKDLPVTNAVGQPFPLKDVKVGFRVVFKVADDQDVVAIKVQWPALWGVLKEIDTTARTLHLQGELRDQVVKISPGAQFIVDTEPGNFADLKVGQPVKVVFAGDGETVLQVQAGKNVTSKDPYRRLTRHAALLLEVNHEQRLLKVVTLPSYSPMTLDEFRVKKDAPIKLLYHYRFVQDTSFDKLTKLLKVVYTVDEDEKTIEAVEAELPFYLRRKVLALDLAKGLLTYEEDRAGKTIELEKNVKVFLAMGEGRLEQITPGQIVTIALTLDRSKAMVLYVWEK
jgi:hypothetical protein